MNLESRLEKYKHVYTKSTGSATRGREKSGMRTMSNPDEEKGKKITEEYLVFKENQDILNKEISQKEIETELLRLNPFHF
jgi:hypothetical protein